MTDMILPPAEIRRFEIEAPVVSHPCIQGYEYEIVFAAPAIAQAALPGQFLELLTGNGYVPFVRRPFSICRVDRGAGTCSVRYLARGPFTSGLAQKKVGDTVSLLGPLGKPFTPTLTPSTRHILIAGGIGAPPLYFLASEICRIRAEANAPIDNVVVLNGARTRDLLVGLAEFAALGIPVHTVTDDGSHGHKGVVTELLALLLDADHPHKTRLFTCGPTPMLRAVAAIALRRGISCQISIETAMPCGIGICNGCAVTLHAPQDHQQSQDHSEPQTISVLACLEGPVFEAEQLLW